MTDVRPDPHDAAAAVPTTTRVHDRRLLPRGVLPRQVQTWLMVAVAGVMLLIILVTGRQAPPVQPLPADRAATPMPPSTDQIRSFQQQLADDEVRRQSPALAATDLSEPEPPGTGPDPNSDEAMRRSATSLFADNVAFSRRSGMPASPMAAGAFDAPSRPSDPAGWDPVLLALAAAANSGGANRAAVTPPAPAIPPSPASPPQASSSVPNSMEETSGSGMRHRLLEGSVIEAVLLNRLDGTYAGPVTAMVTTPVYSQDRQHVVIPAGARVLGTASAVQAWGDTRLALSFHRLTMPEGQVHSLDQFKGLNQIGETGLRDHVNRHYWQVFGASLAVGALSGLAQFGTRSGVDMDVADASRQAAGAGLATSTARILDRYLNVLPTVTIREGYRIKVYLTSDLDLPAYPAPRGGVR